MLSKYTHHMKQIKIKQKCYHQVHKYQNVVKNYPRPNSWLWWHFKLYRVLVKMLVVGIGWIGYIFSSLSLIWFDESNCRFLNLKGIPTTEPVDTICLAGALSCRWGYLRSQRAWWAPLLPNLRSLYRARNKLSY